MNIIKEVIYATDEQGQKISHEIGFKVLEGQDKTLTDTMLSNIATNRNYGELSKFVCFLMTAVYLEIYSDNEPLFPATQTLITPSNQAGLKLALSYEEIEKRWRYALDQEYRDAIYEASLRANPNLKAMVDFYANKSSMEQVQSG